MWTISIKDPTYVSTMGIPPSDKHLYIMVISEIKLYDNDLKAVIEFEPFLKNGKPTFPKAKFIDAKYIETLKLKVGIEVNA